MAMSRSQMSQQISKPPMKKKKPKDVMPKGLTYYRKGGKASRKSKGSKICPEGKAWAKRTFDTYPSAYANLAASKYCKDPNYAKKSKGGKRKGRKA
jgi:mannose/cellobiose epimerase-like protein (N-acyl-D-glucosamine 2-epimerase family)|tara:strand:+ start:46 stop:333 length:288 start_codon:yes stop_codon:yes gene_type:complete